MTNTTAYERKIRRNEVVRLRAQGYTRSEIAEEVGVSKDTIDRDIKRINNELNKLDDPEVLKRKLRKGATTLLEEEYQDLHRADREQDERAKHRAKSSMRQTLELLQNIEDEFSTGSVDNVEEWLDSKPDEVREQIADAAAQDVEEILEVENEG